MRLRVVDYIGNEGGGMRYAVQAIAALRAAREGVAIEVVSHGAALGRYSSELERAGVAATFVDARPVNSGARALWGAQRVKKLRRLLNAFGVYAPLQFTPPDRVSRAADAVWFPWLHMHAPPPAGDSPVVATLHDLIFFEDPRTLPRGQHARERRVVESWLGSPHRIVMTSRATVGAAVSIFGMPGDRATIIRVAERHREASPEAPPSDWGWVEGRFVLLPANLSPHKGHETALRAWASWRASSGGPIPTLVLCGPGADFGAAGRGRALRRDCEGLGLTPGEDVVSVGFVDDGVYFSLLRRAWAVLMPTTHEGGGSFPVAEAVRAGVPSVSSDIPVIREHMEALNAEVHWFAVNDHEDLARTLAALESSYDVSLERARSRVAALNDRTWADVAVEYLDVFNTPAHG